MEDNINASLAISDILIDAINKKYDSIRDLNSIKVNISEEGFDDMNPVIDSIIEEENNHIGKLQQLVDLLTGGEENIAEGKEETIEIIDNNDEFTESIITMKKKLKLQENFNNVIDDVQAVADPVFVGANEEHDDNKKNFENTIKNNEKEAKETVPKEGETGKKVTSPALKKMKLSEKLFDEDLDYDIYSDFNADIYNALADTIFSYQDKGVTRNDIERAIEWFETHFFEDEFEEPPKMNHLTGVHENMDESSLHENFKSFEIGDVVEVPFHDGQEGKVVDIKGDQVYVEWDDGKNPVHRDSFYKSDFKNTEITNESLPVKIAKEQLKRFNEGKMPEGWTAGAYITKLYEKKHITEEEKDDLKEWFLNEGTVSRSSLKGKKDLSQVENSMTKVLTDNIDSVNKSKTVDELFNTVSEIFKNNNIDTKASNRLLMNIKKNRSLSGAQSVVFNSILDGGNNGVIKL